MGFNLSEWALKNRSLVVYMMIVAVIAGLMAYRNLGRSEDPAFVIKTMVVAAAWPGATMDDTLNQVTERLERTLQEVPNLDGLRSYTKPGETTIFVDLKGSTPPAVVPDMWYEVRKRIADVRHTLPLGVVGPFMNDDFGDTFGIIYAFTASPGFTQRELRDYVEGVRSQLLHVSDVAKIEILGAQDERVFVEFSMADLARRGINRQALIAALQAQNTVRPSGIIRSDSENLWLRVSGAFENEQSILNTNFVVDGRMLRLGDIATVRRGYADPPQPLFRVDGEPGIALAISMGEGGDILALGRNLQTAMDRIEQDLPVGIEVHLVADQAVTVQDAISDFMESLWQAIAIILVVSFISLGVRPGLMVALSIPFTLAIVFAIMDLRGIDMQRISLGALIIALALMVDDAMTTTDAMLTRLAAGDSKEQAATFAFRHYAFAMLSGTLVTMAGFVPIGFAASSAGEYTYTLFAVVSIALIVSWLVAVIFGPLFGAVILKPPKAEAKPSKVMAVFRSFLTLAMRGRWVTIPVTIVAFVASVLALPLIPQQFFPASDRPELVVDMNLPHNASIYASEDLAKRFDAILKDDPDVARWSTYVGRGAIRFYLPLNPELPNDSFTQAVIVAKDVEARDRLRARLEKVFDEQFPALIFRVSPLELGPPVGWPLQYRVVGPDLEKVRDIAFRLAGTISRNPNAQRVNFDWIQPARQMRIRIDQDQARLLGLSSQAVADTLNTMISGSTVTQIRDDIYLVNVVVRATDDERVSVANLATTQVALPGGRTVPLSQFATIENELAFPLVWRRDREPTLTVLADTAPGKMPASVVAELAPSIETLNRELPPGYRIETGGSVEDSAEAQDSVFAVIPVMLLLMFTVLMVQLRSFQKLVLVLSVAPLGLIGVVAALLLSGKPMGFVALLGVLALLGMIIKNGVILIGQIDAERAEGKSVWDAALDAASARFRPIMLTALSTILGMIPIAPTVFWGPMAFAIMGGLFVATLLTLIFLPTLYVTWFRGKAPAAV